MRKSSPQSSRIAHIGIAVRSISEVLPFYREILGLGEMDLADTDGARIVLASDQALRLAELLEEAGHPVAVVHAPDAPPPGCPITFSGFCVVGSNTDQPSV